MNETQGIGSFRIKRCKKCGKEFIPAPYHVYKDSHGYWCSWTCFNHRNDTVKQRGNKKYKGKRVLQYAKNGEFVARYSSMAEAARMLNADPHTIKKACAHSTTVLGFVWKWEEDEES